jgi:Tol biopolymer transport system component
LAAIGTHGSDGEGFYTFTREGARLIKSDVSGAPDLINRNQYDRVRFIWNHAGTGLLLEATVNTVQNLWRVDVDPVSLAWRSAERVTTGAGDVQAAVSSDEQHIAYTQRTSSMRLWSFPIDALRGRLDGEGQPFSEEDGSAGDVDLTPDGTKAVYDIARSGRAGTEIWVTTFGGETKLAVPDGYDPKWTADGRSFAYIKFRTDVGLSSLMLHEEDGRDRQVSDWSNIDTRTLLPLGPADDRSMLVAAATTDAAPLWVWGTDLQGNAPRRVLFDRPRINVWQGRLSPNRRWLALIQETTGSPSTPQIAIARADHGTISALTQPLTMLPSTDKPRWSPDGRVLYFLTRKSGFYNLGGIRFDAERGIPLGPPFELTHFNSPRLSVSPLLNRSELGVSLRRAALTMISATGNIWMLDSVDK